MVRAIYTTVSNSDFYETIRADAAQGETNWTVSRHAHIGDWVLLYVTAPISAIVAWAIVATEPEHVADPSSPWHNSYMADMHSLTMLAEPIKRGHWLTYFPEWRYWKQPRNSVRVPKEYESAVSRLLKVDASADKAA
jgi:hypothetical protein